MRPAIKAIAFDAFPILDPQPVFRLAAELFPATPQILQAGIRSSGLEDVFEHVLSTDGVKTFKPDPRAYRMGREAFGLATDEILFVAFAGWDAAGAKWFGYPTFWMNRTGQPTEQLGVTADGIGESMSDLLRFLDLAPTRSPVD